MSEKPGREQTGGQPKVAVVTGAGGGIGRALVSGLLDVGFVVVATDETNEKIAGVPDSPARLNRLAMDVRDRVQVRRVAELVCDSYGDIDLLINNAGIFRKGSLLDLNDDEARQVIDINLMGALVCMSTFGSLMARRRSGRIINIASVAGITGTALSPAYAASKAGLIAATRSAARELADHGVVVTAIAPGYCDTPMLAPERGLIEAFAVPRIPLKRIAKPAEVAEVALFLATCRTPYVTGSIITLDGGLHAG